MNATAVYAQTNSWLSSVDNFWDVDFAWSLGGPPSLSQSATLITNDGTKIIRIDQCSMEFAPGSTTISNLNLTAPVGSLSTLILSNSPDISCTPSPQLTVVNDFTIGARGVLNIETDSTVRVQGVTGGAFSIDGEVRVGRDGTLIATNVTTWIGLGGDGTLTTAGGTAQFGDIVVATNASIVGTLIIGDGTLVASNLLVASSPNSTGAVWVTGTGQLIVTNDFLSVGSPGVGQMTVSNGEVRLGDLTVANGAGAGGTITFAGGTNQIARSTSIALGTGSTGTVWITGGFVNPALGFGFTVGVSGSGQLILSNGTLRSDLMAVGGTGGSVGTLTVAGGTLDGPAALQAGNAFAVTGTVWITGGTVALTNNSFIQAIGNGGVGFMTVSNGLVTANSINLGIGTSVGRGTLTVAGGTNRVYATMLLGNYNCTATGIVVVAGGRLDVTNSTGTAVLDVRSGTVALNSGTLTVDVLVLTNACGHFNRTGGTLAFGSLVLDPNLDADGDGLPNGWEQMFGLDPLDSTGENGANGDPDGDGLSNEQEFSLGTDPTDSSSPYRITDVVQEGDDVRLTWQTVGGKTNFVQATSDLTTNFTDITPAIAITGAGVTSTNYLDLGAVTNFPAQFYRIRFVP
jgi:T5SS/PEP-CTERM-associated repeat protein